MQKIRTWLSSSWVPRLGAGALGALIIFSLGLGVGSGRIQMMPTASSQNTTLPAQLDYSSVSAIYDTLKNNYDGKLTESQLLDGLKEGLAEATKDPYTEYFNPNQAKQFASQLNNSFSGIGAVLGKDDAGNLIIVSPIKGFPADRAGLQAKDVIVSINGESASGMSPDVAAGKIRGPKGTTVILKILRNKTDNLTFAITRDDIKIPSVSSRILDGNIGYMQIISFSDDTATLARQAATSFKRANVKGVVLDLRGNPGGLLDAAVDVSSLWLPAGKTVVTEKGTGGDQTYASNGGDILSGIPTAVLIDDGSASASEITAGALHDNGAAQLIGEKSYGKGVVQQLINFSDGSELKVTVASWYRPNGQNINKKGITPDQIVGMTADQSKAGNDTQLQAAEAYLSK